MALSISEATRYDIQKGLLTLLSGFSLLKMPIYRIPQSISIVLSLHPATLCGVYKCNVISGELSNFTWKICHVPMPCWVIILKPNINMLIVQSGYFIYFSFFFEDFDKMFEVVLKLLSYAHVAVVLIFLVENNRSFILQTGLR